MNKTVALILSFTLLTVAVIACTCSSEPAPTGAPAERPTQAPREASPPTPTPASPSLGDTRTRPTDGMVMVYVPPGEFSMVCALFCDPTGVLGVDTCSADLGVDFYCLSIRNFYSDLPDLDPAYGFCLDENIWGPAECWNGQQDTDEDGVDCCAGNPNCSCVFACS